MIGIEYLFLTCSITILGLGKFEIFLFFFIFYIFCKLFILITRTRWQIAALLIRKHWEEKKAEIVCSFHSDIIFSKRADHCFQRAPLRIASRMGTVSVREIIVLMKKKAATRCFRAKMIRKKIESYERIKKCPGIGCLCSKNLSQNFQPIIL